MMEAQAGPCPKAPPESSWLHSEGTAKTSSRKKLQGCDGRLLQGVTGLGLVGKHHLSAHECTLIAHDCTLIAH